MKIGFSLGGCVRDIVESKVDDGDVLMIIASTYMKNSEDLESVINSYLTSHVWGGLDPDACRSMTRRLWDHHKIVQPRLNGLNRRSFHCIWADLYVSPEVSNPALAAAWEQYRMLANLSGHENIDEFMAQSQWKNH